MKNEESEKSAIVFINILMVIFYTSIAIYMISFALSVIESKVNIFMFIASIMLIISVCGTLFVDILDKHPLKSNITYKARWKKMGRK